MFSFATIYITRGFKVWANFVVSFITTSVSSSTFISRWRKQRLDKMSFTRQVMCFALGIYRACIEKNWFERCKRYAHTVLHVYVLYRKKLIRRVQAERAPRRGYFPSLVPAVKIFAARTLMWHACTSLMQHFACFRFVALCMHSWTHSCILHVI